MAWFRKPENVQAYKRGFLIGMVAALIRRPR